MQMFLINIKFQIIEGNANLSIGMFGSSFLRNNLMTPSHVYYSSAYVLIIPPAIPHTAFEKIFKPLQKIVWFYVVSVFIVAFVVITWLKLKNVETVTNFVLGHRNQTPYLNVINIFLGGSALKVPNFNFARSILMFYILYCLVIRTIYQGALFDYLQSDARAAEVSSIDEMVKRDFRFYMLTSAQENVKGLTAIYERYLKLLRNLI